MKDLPIADEDRISWDDLQTEESWGYTSEELSKIFWKKLEALNKGGYNIEPPSDHVEYLAKVAQDLKIDLTRDTEEFSEVVMDRDPDFSFAGECLDSLSILLGVRGYDSDTWDMNEYNKANLTGYYIDNCYEAVKEFLSAKA